MMKRSPSPTVFLIISGVLSAVVLCTAATGNPYRILLPISGAGLVLLIPVLLKGDSWQKMVAGALLFIPCFGLLAGIMDQS